MGNRTSSRRLALGLAFLAGATLGVLWGQPGSRTLAAPKPIAAPARGNEAVPPAPTPPEASSDYSQRVVAYIFGTMPITREDLGEYLIARQGAERLNNLVNKRIIEHVARQKGLEVTAAEVEAALEEDLRGINVDRKAFVDRVLKQYNKTLYEWKEDVIKPRLLMSKMCRDRVRVDEEDIQKAFEAYYGEKIDCRILLYPESEKKHVMMKYAELRDNEKEFDTASRQQSSPTLAAAGGHIKPIGRYTTGNEEMEKAAFALKPGELSQVISTPEGLLIIKCIGRIPPETTAKLEEKRPQLQKEVYEKKVQVEIPKFFKEMRDLAQPKLILKAYTTEEELMRDVREEISSGAKSERGFK